MNNTFSRLGYIHRELARNLAFVPVGAFTKNVVLYPGMAARVAALRAEQQRLVDSLQERFGNV